MQFLNAMWADLQPTLISFATALVPLLLAQALKWMRERQMNTTIVEAAARGAGVAYTHLATTGGTVRDPIAVASAVAKGVEYMVAQVPGYMEKRGVDVESAERIILGQLGALLSKDPSVKVGG